MKLKNLIKKTLLAAFPFAASLLVATGASAWGPERATFTMENPATYPTFNSITNNPTIGDERDFVRIGEIHSDVTTLGNEVEIIPGKQYVVYIYFHNNASSTFNDSAHNNSGVAVLTRMSSAFSTVLTPAEKGSVSATITAKNSNPASVWDEAYMTTNYSKIFLHYVSGSAKIYNDWEANNTTLPSSLFTEEGTLLGLNKLNGLIPGCEEYHGVVTYVLEAEELKGTIEKQASLDGVNFANNVTMNPGDEATFLLTVRNAGDVALTNVTIADAIPSGLELVSGSVQYSANNSGVWDNLSDNLIGTGYNIGTVGTGNFVQIKYRARAVANNSCGDSTLSNTASLTYDSDSTTGETTTATSLITVKGSEECPEDCATNPNLPECEEPTEENCTTNPSLAGCTNPSEEDCNINPNLPGCEIPSEIVKTGPLEITLAVVIALGIGGAGFYFWRTHRTLKTVENVVSGPSKSTSPSKSAGPSKSAKSNDAEPSKPELKGSAPSEKSAVDEYIRTHKPNQ